MNDIDRKKRWGLITRLIEENNFKNIAEIGVKYGENAGHILRLNPELENFILVDPYINEEFYSSIPKNICTYFNKKSNEAIKFVADNSLDLIFIDGDHSYKVVKQDIIDWYQKVRKGGILCGHDYHPNKDGVVKAVDELIPNFNKEVDNCWWIIKNTKSKNINIDWGHGKITRGNWQAIQKLIDMYNITSVLEFGAGLSTELFSLEKLNEFVSYDILEEHVEKLQKALPNTNIIHYDKEKIPDIDKKYDMVFIDGPAGDRSKELELANKIATKVIYCDDWGRGQDKVKLGWRPLSEVDPTIIKGEKDQHIYINEKNIY